VRQAWQHEISGEHVMHKAVTIQTMSHREGAAKTAVARRVRLSVITLWLLQDLGLGIMAHISDILGIIQQLVCANRL
jgi:acyl CoA:acetate/3-ketoacid CoA transferase